jgi:hypothetical protein
LNTHHANEYSFQHKTTPDGRLHILAKPLLATDDPYKPEQKPPTQTSELIYVENWCRYSNCLVKGTVAPPDLITMLPPNEFPYPKRPYYHPETGSVLTLGQWLHETENVYLNEEWRREMEDELIDEFTDVTEPEKEFIKLWNGFLSDKIVLLPDLVPRPTQFIEKFAIIIHAQGLYDELLAHLMNMWDNGHLGRQAMHWLCVRFSTLIADETDSTKRRFVCMLASDRKRKDKKP